MNIDFTNIFELILSIVSVIVSCFLIPWLKEKLSAEKLNKLVTLVRIAVEAAEQMYDSGTGQQKKEYVMQFLLSKGIVFDEEEIDAIIESSVFQLPEWLEAQLVEESVESEVE